MAILKSTKNNKIIIKKQNILSYRRGWTDFYRSHNISEMGPYNVIYKYEKSISKITFLPTLNSKATFRFPIKSPRLTIIPGIYLYCRVQRINSEHTQKRPFTF